MPPLCLRFTGTPVTKSVSLRHSLRYASKAFDDVRELDLFDSTKSISIVFCVAAASKSCRNELDSIRIASYRSPFPSGLLIAFNALESRKPSAANSSNV